MAPKPEQLTVAIMDTLIEKKARQVVEQYLSTPVIPAQLLSSGDPQAYLESTLARIDSLYQKAHLQVTDLIADSSKINFEVLIIARAQLIKKLTESNILFNLPTVFIASFGNAHLFNTFDVVISKFVNNARIEIVKFQAFVADKNMTQAQFDTRWVLQIKDLNPPSIAYEMAKKL